LRKAISLALCMALASSLFAADKPQPKAEIKKDSNAVDYEAVTRIRDQAFRHSEVMQTLSELSDGIGPRLTNSPNQKRAAEWAMTKMRGYGLQNVHVEPWGEFGKGWSYHVSHVRMTSPDTAELIALPKAWSLATNGNVHAKAIHTVIRSKADFDRYKGKLAGLIVFNGELPKLKPSTDAKATRYSDKEIEQLSMYEVPADRSDERIEARKKRIQFIRELNSFLAGEKAAALVEPSRAPFDGGTIAVQGNGFGWMPNEPLGVPVLVMSSEHYGRVARLVDRDVPVELDVDVQAQFTDNGGDLKGYNVVGEIPGSDLKDQLVIVGGHLDSWHGATGATDNAAGCAVMLESLRILQKLGLKPRRTVRVVLWTGEEQGLLGSLGYAKQHLAYRPTDESQKDVFEDERPQTGPLQLKPEHAKTSIYFNVDSGTGKIRGVSLQENAALAPIFRAWMEPFRDLGMNLVTMNNSFGSDFLSFDAMSVPGVDFFQDEVEYETRTHHTNMDTYERIQRDDMLQASAIVASFAYHAAMRDEMMPRKPLPQPEGPRPKTKSESIPQEPK
jgi:hypothetical protein